MRAVSHRWNSLPVITAGMVSEVTIEANAGATVLLVSYGAFVMNAQEEISEAIVDCNGGKFDRMQ